jgi:penicillin-binding protein 1A
MRGLFRGTVYHAFLIPVVVLVAGGLVALAMLPAVASAGRAVKAADKTLLGDTNPLIIPTFPLRSTIYAADGTILATLFQDENREYLTLDQVAPIARDAVISVEDHNFYKHGPVDFTSILRAALANLKAGRVVQGGSTITQQLVKNTEVGAADTFKRKFQEAQLAFRLERTYSKNQILELYLNEVYLGHQTYGIGAASEYYFGTTADKITLPQAALLAGMIQAPVSWDPILHPADAMFRRNTVLGDMLKYGYISQVQYDQAIGTPIRISKRGRTANAFGREPYWTAYVVNLFENNPAFGKTLADRKRLLFQGGLKIYTTLQPKLQNAARNIIKQHLPHAGPQPPSDPQAALATVVPQTGAIQVMVGGMDYTKSKFDLAWQGRRSTGSAFKAFTLVAAMEQGVPPGRVYDSRSPQTIDGCQAGGWTVNNAEPGGGGFLNLWSATSGSVNVVFAQLIRDVGPENVLNAAAVMGIPRSQMQPVCSLTLGTGVGTNPLEMASAYSTLANGGVHCQPFAIAKVVGANNKVLFRAKAKCKQVIPAPVSAQVTAMLQGVISHGTGTAANIGRPEAGKTGTGQNYQDAWFMGYVPQLTTGVWVGYPKAEIPMRNLAVLGGRNAFGGSIAAPIWHDFMLLAVANLPVKSFPQAPPQKGGTIPDVTGLQQKDAEDALTKANFVPIAKPVDSTDPKGTVVTQSPAGGSSAPLGSAVTINVSTGIAPTKAVPNVVGKTQAAASATLKGVGYAVKVVFQTVSDPSKDGIVLSQSPGAGTKLQVGKTVTIVVGQLSPSPSPSPT